MNKKYLFDKAKFIKHSTKQKIAVATCGFILLCLTLTIIVSGVANKSAMSNTETHLSGIENEVIEITKYLDKLENSVIESQMLIDSIQKESGYNHEMILEKASEIDNTITSLIQNYEEMAVNIKTDDALIKSYLFKLMQSLEKSKNELYLLLMSDFQDTHNALDSKVLLLSNLLYGLMTKILVAKDETHDLLADLKDTVKSGNESITETTLTSFDEIKKSLEFIDETHIHLLSEIHDLHFIALNTENENHYELVDILVQMEMRLSDDSSISLDTLITYLEQMDDNSYQNHLELLYLMRDDYDSMLEEINYFHSVTLNFENENHAELLDIINQMDVRISSNSASSLEIVIRHMELLNDISHDKLTSEMISARDNVNSNTDAKTSDVTMNVDNRFSELNQRLNTAIAEAETKLANQIEAARAQLFLSVSDGKNYIATALLTNSLVVERNVSDIPDTETERAELPFLDYANIIANHDNAIKDGKSLLANALISNNKIIVSGINSQSSFSAFKTAIDKAICANLNCGIAPNVIYTHHYHTISDDAGTDALNDNLDNTIRASSGGCYQAAVPHVHQGNTLSGGSCYGTVSHSHGSSCYVAYVHGGNQYTCPFDGNVYRDWAVPDNACHFGYPFNANGSYCANCGQFASNHQFGQSRCYTMTCSVHPFSLSCGKSIDGYKTNCGRMRGEITSATIMY